MAVRTWGSLSVDFERPRSMLPASMRSQLYRSIAALLLLATGCGTSATGLPLDPARQAVEGKQALEYIKVLSSRGFEGRGVDTEGIDKAADYIAAHFK